MANRRIFDIIFRTKGLEKGKQGADGLDNSLNSLAETAKTAAIGFASMQTVLKSVELAKLAATAETVRRSFGNLAKEPDKMLQAMKKATAGTITEMELMQKFNEASLLGLPLERFDEMLNIARGAAQSTGQSMEFMLNSIVVALGRGSKLMLDNLGIMIDVEKANKDYAESNNIVGRSLTDVEKKQAFVNTALAIGNENLQRSGGVVASNIDSFGRFSASVGDLSEAFGKTLVPGITSTLNFLSDLADNTAAFFKVIDRGVSFFDKFAEGVSNTAKEYFGLTEEVETATKTLDKFQQMQVFGERIKELKAQQALIDASIEEQQRGVLKSQGFFAALFGELTGANEAARSLVGVSGEIQKAGLEIYIQQLTDELDKYGLTLDDVRINKLTPFVEKKYDYLKAVKATIEGNETERAYLDSLKGSYSEFISQQQTTLENKEKEQAFIDRFVSSYPEQAEALGLVSSAQEKHQLAVEATAQSFGTIGDAASSTADLLATLAGDNKALQMAALQIAKIAAVANIAQGVTKAFAQGGILGFASGAAVAAAGAAQIAVIESQISSLKKAEFGMDEMVSKPTLILAGEAGPERVNITPASRPSSEQGSGGMTINFLGPVTDREFVRDTIIPEIQKVSNLGLA